MSSSTPFFPARSWDTVANPSCSPGDGDGRGFCSPCTPPSLSPDPLYDTSVLLSVPRGYLQPQPLFPAPKSLLPVCQTPQSRSHHPQVQPQYSQCPTNPAAMLPSASASPNPTPVPPTGPCFQGTQQCISLLIPSTLKSHPITSHWYHPPNPTPAHQIRPPVLPSAQTPIPSSPNPLHQYLPVPPCLKQLSPVSHAPSAAQSLPRMPPGCPQVTNEGEGGVPAQAAGGLQQRPVRPQVPVERRLRVPVAVVRRHLWARTAALSMTGTCQGAVSPPSCSAPCPHWPPLRWAGPARRQIRATCPPAPRTGQGCPG